MEVAPDFPDRVARDGDGAYCWTYDMKKQGNAAPFCWMTMICLAVFAPIVLALLVLIWPYGALTAVLVFLGILALGLGLPALILKVCPLNPGYRMSGTEIETWPRGRGSGIHPFGGVRRVKLRPDIDRIQLRWAGSGLHVYVPKDDYGLVREFILAHVPEGTEVVRG